MILPLSLKIVLAIGILLFVMLLIAFRSKKRRRIWTFIVLLLLDGGIGIWLGLKEFNRTNKDPANARARYRVAANDLIHEFETGDSLVMVKKYDDEIIEVTGNVKEIKNDGPDLTIILGDSTGLSAVQCEMNDKYRMDAAGAAKNSSVIIKGHFVGFRKGEMMMDVSLGSTLNLNRCVQVRDK